jgi:hypothetical protein
MKRTKKRRARRTYHKYNELANLPVRRTKEIATTHLEGERTRYIAQQQRVVKNLEENEDGKELFDFVLKSMLLITGDSFL